MTGSVTELPMKTEAKEGAHAGTLQFQVRQGRERTNSEETAMILTAMAANKDDPTPTQDDEKVKADDDDEGWSSDGSDKGRRGGSSAANRMKYQATKLISIDELRDHFDQPIVEVARHFGICITLMKKVCRRNGIKRWPHRQIRSLTKSISSMEAAMMTANVSEREKYEEQIRSLVLKRDAVIADPNKEVSVSLAKASVKDEKRSPRSAGKLHDDEDDLQDDENGDDDDDNIGGSPAVSPKTQPQAGKDDGAARTFILPASHPRPPPPQYEVKGGRWTAQEHASFLEGIKLYGKNWRRVAQVVGTRNAVQTRTHAQKYLLKTSAHLEIHLALLNKAAVDEAPSAFDKLQALAASAHDEVVGSGLDHLSAVVSEAAKSPRDKLNFATPLVLSASPRRLPGNPSSSAASTLRKLVLARKPDDASPLQPLAKKLKPVADEPLPGNENAVPNANSG
ncbi:hypothetical protein SPRG_04083 [Saprolegnia parasitica CBS 223.65]|uniref:HTH myb-type domain-containing protein n=1 Tax=Saprolegnia parasitica (strain CBS 223.65) TaxID=695850 RepID=A0A067CLR6_SAPPC|nr:hypothetical protein SPRG_04083 [Saprolegnia parasitica CBS 223.65]KDO31468.1 hypothetical protein SPRG_04083 [Saprolegnia parasitica CBS 223.65]|eukprot:XP_012198061.1 hypothetical protein SPRG_04083 [Saprolegnia parasitica CBS 223.65]